MPVGYGALNDSFWIDLCHNFSLLLLVIVSVSLALLTLYFCRGAMSEQLARSRRGRGARGMRRSVREPSQRGFTTSL